MTRNGSESSGSSAGTPGPALDDPALARERTALAWTRSALNLAAGGTLIARGAFVAGLDALGVASAVFMAGLAMLTWRHGQAIYDDRRSAGDFPYHQTGALSLLTLATILTAGIAIVVTLAL